MKKALKAILCIAIVVGIGASLYVKLSGKDKDLSNKKIGVLQFVSHPALDSCNKGAIAELEKQGLTKENTTFDQQNANGDTALANTIAQKMVADKCDIIIAIATPAAQAVYSAIQGTDVKLVYAAVSDPVAAGLVKSTDTATENVSGVSDMLDVSAQVELVGEILPDAKTIGVLYNTGEANSTAEVAKLEKAATKAGLGLEKVAITNTSEVSAGLDSVMKKSDVVVNVLDNTVVSALDLEIAKSLEKKVPVIGSEDTQVERGALASSGFDYVKVGSETATVLVDMLEGKKPLPITATGTKATVNQTTAKKLGIDITGLKNITVVK